MTDIEKIREALIVIETSANSSRDNAIDNRGHVIELAEAVQFEEIAVLARNALLLLDRLAARVGEAKEPVLWRHKVRDTIYEEIGEAQLQTREYVGDDEYLVLYRGGDGKLWARPMGEFHDGRFERIVPLSSPPETNDGR